MISIIRILKKSILLFTDTDSLTYKVETDDIYEDFRRHAHLFDFSGYPKEHKCYSVKLGKMKDELNGNVMEEFVGLKAKMYSFCIAGKEEKKAKGIKQMCHKKANYTQ